MKRLFTICLVLLLCASAHATKIASADDSTAIAAVQTSADALLILGDDILASNKVAGDVFYVNSNATGSGTGADWTNAEITIEGAVADCTAGAGDWIMVHPSHAETAGTAFVDLDKTDVTVWGIGNGTRMPTMSYDTTTDTFIIGATGDGTKVHGIKFIATVTAVASAIVVEAGCTDFVIEDCVFENETTTVDEFIDTIYITGTASDRGIIRRNRFLGDVGANAGPKASINFIDCDFLQIYENEFSGDIGDAHIFNETTASNYITIRDNRIMCGYIGGNLDTTPGISLVATTTGWIQDNFIVTNVGTPDLAIVAADCYVSDNTYNEAQGGAFGAETIGTVAGQVYASVVQATVQADNLFDVSGGPILITSFVGVVTTNVQAQQTILEIILDADAGFTDHDFTSEVDFTGDAAGTTIVFSNANEAVLTELAGADRGGSTLQSSWFCGEGMIEQATADTSTGAIKWYMTWIPYVNGTTVTKQ